MVMIVGMSEDDDARLIEHDPKEPVHDPHSLPAGYVFGIFGIAFAGYLSRHELPPMDWRDYVAWVVFFALLVWCFSPRRMRAGEDAHGHEGARKSLAFRLGKKLNRVLHYGRRNTTIRD